MSFDLSPFCESESEESGRYSLKSPWIEDGWQYATDSRIGVRQPTADSPANDDTKHPEAAWLFENFPRCTDKWPHHDGTTVSQQCPTCTGTMKTGCECPDCEHVHQASCPCCVDGTVPGPRLLVIGGRMIAGKYCLKIHALGNVLYCPDGKPGDHLAFSVGDLQGIVAALREDLES